MIIRAAEEKDLITCTQLVHEPELAFADGRYPDDAFFRRYIEYPYFLVGIEDGKVIGFIVGEPLKGGLVAVWYIVIQKNKRGQGFGSQLLTEYNEQMTKLGKKYLLLYSSMKGKTPEFYKHHGFHQGETYVEMLKPVA